MPLSDPYSSYLDRLARQRAEDELMRSRLGEASEQFGKGLGQWNEALRIQKADTRQAEQDTAKTAQTAFENEQTVEGLRLRKAQDARDAAQAQASEARAATTFANAQADRPIEEARAAEDRAFTLRQRETSTADAARKAAIERIKALPPQTAMGDDVDVHGLIVQTGAAGGLTPDEALGLYRDAQQARTDARRTADLEARAKEAQIKKAERVGTGGSGGTPKPTRDAMPDVRTRTKARQLSTAEGVLDEIEKAAAEFEKQTEGSALGRITGRVRGALTGYVPGLNESERTTFLANAEALNAMLFPILGREDAPTETEVKRLGPLMIGGETTPTELAAKIKALRRMLQIQAGSMPGAAPADAAPSTAAAGLPSADEFFGG